MRTGKDKCALCNPPSGILCMLCATCVGKSPVGCTRARICKRLWSPGIDSGESTPPGYVAWRAGTINMVAVPARQAGNRFLGSLKDLQIPVQYTISTKHMLVCGKYSAVPFLRFSSCVHAPEPNSHQ